MGLFGRDESFYDLLEAQAETAHRAAEAYLALTLDFANIASYVEQIDEIESEGDTLTHQLANKVDATFVTPLDKEDLHALGHALDDITDLIDASSARMFLYKIPSPRPDLKPLVTLLVDITAETRKAVNGLRNLKERNGLHGVIVHIHELENQSDRTFRQALADLFDEPGADPLMVMKWKEVYDRIERAVDKCEDIANMVESVVVKYA